jgi:hypothetical protein
LFSLFIYRDSKKKIWVNYIMSFAYEGDVMSIGVSGWLEEEVVMINWDMHVMLKQELDDGCGS